MALVLSSALTYKLYSVNTMLISVCYTTGILLTSSCVKIVMESCHQDRINRMYLYLLFLVNILPIVLIYDKQWSILTKAAIGTSVFLPIT